MPSNRFRTCITIVRSKNRDYVLALLIIHAHNNTMQEGKQKRESQRYDRETKKRINIRIANCRYVSTQR